MEIAVIVMNKCVNNWTFIFWVTLGLLLANNSSLAQDYSGVEKFDLAQLEVEVKDAQLLLVLNSTKALIDNKHGCGEYSRAAKKQRQSLIDLQTEYKTKPVNDLYARQDKALRAAFSEAAQTYEKCFDNELSDFPYLMNVANINSYSAFKQERKTMGRSLAKRGDLPTYIAMLKDLIAYEKEILTDKKPPPQASNMFGLNLEESSQQSVQPKVMTMADAVNTSRKFIRALEKFDIENMYAHVSIPLQKKLLAVRSQKDMRMFAFLPKRYIDSSVKCALCFTDQILGDICQVEIYNKRKAQRTLIMFSSVLLTLEPVTTEQGSVPKITNIAGKVKVLKKFRKKNPVCDGL